MSAGRTLLCLRGVLLLNIVVCWESLNALIKCWMGNVATNTRLAVCTRIRCVACISEPL